MVCVWLQLLMVGLPVMHAFSTLSNVALPRPSRLSFVLQLRQPSYDDDDDDDDDVNHHTLRSMNKVDIDESNTRRKLFQSVSNICAVMFLGVETIPSGARADDTAAATAIAMKTFIDPEGLFIINIPQRFFAIRRTNQGDLPNASTGSGRRGSSIFNAGDLAKAEVLAIERFPTRVLLAEYGVEATGNLTTFPEIGEPSTIANLIAIRRDREKPVATSGNAISKSPIVPNSLYISPDGRELSFTLKTNIDVQKPDLLLEQYGVSVLNRITAAKVSLRSNDGYIMAVFASALESDWQGADGKALQDAVSSFKVIDQISAITQG